MAIYKRNDPTRYHKSFLQIVFKITEDSINYCVINIEQLDFT